MKFSPLKMLWGENLVKAKAKINLAGKNKLERKNYPIYLLGVSTFGVFGCANGKATGGGS